MSRLIKRKMKEPGLPAFKFRKIKKTAASLLVFAVLAGAVYIPSFFPEDKAVVSYYSLDDLDQTLDISDFPDADYDGDGIVNSKDDTPFVFSFDDNQKNELKELTGTADKDTGKGAKSPFETDCGVILWAENYDAKANGTVVKTDYGYRIYDFKGWAHFPESDKKYAYSYDFDKKEYAPLKYNESQKAYYIKGDCFVQLLEGVIDNDYVFEFLGKKHTLKTGGAFWAFLLPGGGRTFLKCYTDTDMISEIESVSNLLDDTEYSISDKMFGISTNTFEDLTKVYNTIRNGQNVLVLLADSEKSSVGIINGIDESGNLVVVNPKSKTYAGKIYVTPKAYKMVNDDSVSTYYTFDFYGFGYSGDSALINFFDVC